MKSSLDPRLIAPSLALLLAGTTPAEVKVAVSHATDATGLVFKDGPAPRRADAAAKAAFTLIDGRRDGNGATLDALHDGQVPTEADQPGRNFFFAGGGDGGRIRVDLGKPVAIREINTFSWHPGARAPQVYTVYASDGAAAGFSAEPKRPADPAAAGWKLIAKVDTRPAGGNAGGPYGVSVTDPSDALGEFRYLLFDVKPSRDGDPFGQTFFSEIDVVEKGAPASEPAPPVIPADTYTANGGRHTFTITCQDAPDLHEWTRKELAPIVQKWYPIIVDLLASDGYEAPRKFSITLASRQNMRLEAPAYAAGNAVTCNADWQRQNLKGEAIGSVVHELVHVVQQYGIARRGRGRQVNQPGWISEGIPDYVRWFLYEPQTRGAEIGARGLASARYDGSYRVSANFLNWATGKYDRKLVTKLNSVMREGTYDDVFWKKLTTKTIQQLDEEWKADLAKKLNVPAPPKAAADPNQNQLTPAEKAAGWKLLFDGRSLSGWSNFKSDKVRPGWQIKDGMLVCADPHDAGDLVTAESFGAFELQLEYNISEGGNSGIIYHITNEGGATWATGPEFQLEDNAKAADPQRCGWLYGLYQPPQDPKTGKPLDATKPAGVWNHVRLLVTPEKCEHAINGVSYFTYVIGSDDFKARVAKTKFAGMPLFAKSPTGFIALQGDHGQIAFRNIKIRTLPAGK